MFWTLMLMSIFPIFQLDRFTRRDIRKYNREIIPNYFDIYIKSNAQEV